MIMEVQKIDVKRAYYHNPLVLCSYRVGKFKSMIVYFYHDCQVKLLCRMTDRYILFQDTARFI